MSSFTKYAPCIYIFSNDLLSYVFKIQNINMLVIAYQHIMQYISYVKSLQYSNHANYFYP